MLIALVMSFTMQAQWSAGARFGANFSGMTGKWNTDDPTITNWIGGLTGGAVGAYNFTDMCALRGELLYITMGEKTSYPDDGSKSSVSNYYFRERFNCLQMLFLAQALFNVRVIALYANAGTFLTYKMGGHWRTENENGNIAWGSGDNRKSSDNTWYVDPEYNRRVDIGIYIGGGAGKELGPGRLELDLRFGFGLIDLNKFESTEAKQDAIDNGYRPYRSLNFTVSLAYLYLFDKNR